MEESIRLLIKGKVQGVFYRASARDMANDLGITGWVKNMTDGNVEILASGEKEQLEKFIRWCENGPRNAHVEEVIVTKADKEYATEFRIIK
jgi:acylphosphatase